jgi:hypothetical protein
LEKINKEDEMKKSIIIFWVILIFFITCSKKNNYQNYSQKKIYVIGLDGVDWDIVDPLIKKGK